MKIGLFSDSHYCRASVPEQTRLTSLSLGKIRDAMEDFKANSVDLVMCLGDMVDVGESVEASRKDLSDVMQTIRSFNLPFLYVTGNHDFNVASIDELPGLVSVPVSPAVFDCTEYRIISLDANYDSDGKHYGPEGYDWTDANLPDAQLQFLAKALEESDKECIIAIHEPIDRHTEHERGQFGVWASVNNAEDVRRIIRDSGKVRLVVQGHVHEYYNVAEDGIRYITVKGMCEGTSNHYMILNWEKEHYELVLKSKE